MRAITAEERRARLARRHHLAPEAAGSDVVAVATQLVGLHATDPATVYLSAQARVPGLVVADVEAALYDDPVRLVKHLCMRRTLFVEPVGLIPVVQAATSEVLAADQRRRLARDVEASGAVADGRAWLAATEEAALAGVARLGTATGQQLTRAVPELQLKLRYAPGKAYGGEVGVTTQVLTILAVEGRIRRQRPNGGWTSSQHRWVLGPPGGASLDPVVALAELIERWLAAFGPATVADVAWWTGIGVTKVLAALARLDVAPVTIDDGVEALVLADDVEEVAPVRPWVALLPALDPTVMGWQGRAWYLGRHGPRLFDRNGNAGPTVWWDGRIVGGWTCGPDGDVRVELLDDPGATARQAVAAEARRLQAWLGGTVVKHRFPTPLTKELAAATR